MAATELESRKKVLHILRQNPLWTIKRVAKHAGVSTSTVDRVVRRKKYDVSVERAKGSGKKSGPMDKALYKSVVTHFKKNPNASVRDIAKKLSTSSSYVQKCKKRAQLKTFKVQKVPDRSAEKETEAKTRARRLYENFLTKYQCCVMDDETYVKGDFKQLPGQEFYVAESKGQVAKRFREQNQSKFPKKFLIWQAICTCGKRSQTFVTTGSVNQDVYIRECLQKRLLPFLRQHSVPSFFWPDLATSHYSKRAMKWYEDNGVNIVPKWCNPPNCPELRPIERYWAMVKRNLKATKGFVKNEKQFTNKWRQSAEKVSQTTVQLMMGHVNGKVREFFRNSCG